MTINSQHNINWLVYSSGQIIKNKSVDGLPLLELFLQDYTEIFSEKVNPNCLKCIENYLNKYKLKLSDMANDSKYVLKKKYNGIGLKAGSNIRVTNATMTDKLGAELFKNHPNPETIFEKSPEQTPKKDNKSGGQSKSADELIELAKTASIDEVNDFLVAEKELKRPRVTVIKALEERLAQLTGEEE